MTPSSLYLYLFSKFCPYLFYYFIVIFKCLFIDFIETETEREGEREREKHQFVVPLIYAFIR